MTTNTGEVVEQPQLSFVADENAGAFKQLHWQTIWQFLTG
jgi:hypothetical protein